MPNYWYDHVHLVGPDPLKAAQFYESMFNARRVSSGELADGRTRVELDLNGSRILLIQPPAQPEAKPAERGSVKGLDHFGIRTDDIDAAFADLKAKGVAFRDEVREARPGVKIAFLWAPDNVLVELLEIKR